MRWVLSLLFIYVFGKPSGEISSSDYSFIVVLPDLHGDAEATLRSLWLAHKKVHSSDYDFEYFSDIFYEAIEGGEISDDLSTYNSMVALVQLGDLVDRGPYTQECIMIILAVEEVLGWTVLPLYGNHEIMSFLNTSGNFVSEKDYALFGGKEEREFAFSPSKQGPLFSLLSSELLAMARLDGPVGTSTLFVHGGIHLAWLRSSLDLRDRTITVDEINQKVDQLIASEVGLRHLNDLEGGSFLWTRELAQESSARVCHFVLEPILQAFNVSRIVLGHTPQASMRARTRCDGRIILADVQMSRWMQTSDVDETSQTGGRPVAIIFDINQETNELDSVVAHYTDLRTGTVDEEIPLLSRILPETTSEPMDWYEAVVPTPEIKKRRKFEAGTEEASPTTLTALPIASL